MCSKIAAKKEDLLQFCCTFCEERFSCCKFVAKMMVLLHICCKYRKKCVTEPDTGQIREGKKRLKKSGSNDMVFYEKADGNDPVGRLMHDFRCLSPADMFYPVLAKQVKFFKETEGGQEIMCQAFEELAEKRVIEEKKAFARRMITKNKLTIEEIAEYTDLPVEEVRELAGLQLA